MKITMIVDVPLTQKDFDDYSEYYDWTEGDEGFKRFLSDDLTEMILNDDSNCEIVSTGTEEELDQITAEVHKSLDKFSELNLKDEIRSLEARLEEAKAELAHYQGRE